MKLHIKALKIISFKKLYDLILKEEYHLLLGQRVPQN